jgi:hypothetical protein
VAIMEMQVVDLEIAASAPEDSTGSAPARRKVAATTLGDHRLLLDDAESAPAPADCVPLSLRLKNNRCHVGHFVRSGMAVYKNCMGRARRVA